MFLQCLRLMGVRNLHDGKINPNRRLNIITGINGSGKTSLLEAIYILSMGRSFRCSDLQPVITHQKKSFICSAEVRRSDQSLSLGIEKKINHPLRLQVGGKDGFNLSQYIGNLVTQLITPDSFNLLTDGPDIRRKFIDLGVFHVKHAFIKHGIRYKKLLKQRNAALKQQASDMVIRAVDEGLIEAGEAITSTRKAYLEGFMPIFNDVLTKFLPEANVYGHYMQGWPENFVNFGDALRASLSQDRRYRMTMVGPHRADLKFSISGYPAQQVLSRGQQKLFVSALIMSQSMYLSREKQTNSVFLIDDLSSELDKNNVSLLLNWLIDLGNQIFITSVDELIWQDLCKNVPYEVFHVEHGAIYTKELC